MALSVLNVSCTWNQTVWGLLCLASFIQHEVSKVHVCCSMNQGYFPFYDWVLVTRRDRSHCVYLLIIWGTVGLFPPLGYRGLYCCELGSTHNCLPMFSALWGPYLEWNSYGNSVFNFLNLMVCCMMGLLLTYNLCAAYTKVSLINNS